MSTNKYSRMLIGGACACGACAALVPRLCKHVAPPEQNETTHPSTPRAPAPHVAAASRKNSTYALLLAPLGAWSALTYASLKSNQLPLAMLRPHAV